MKITSTRGDWTGLAYWKDCMRQVDHFSSPDGWRFGFEIVYRLIFLTSDKTALETFKTSFKGAFGLTDKHYDLEQQLQSGSSVFWYVYWDKEGIDLGLLDKCEAELNKIAKATDTRIVVLGIMIIPRSLEYIRDQINK